MSEVTSYIKCFTVKPKDDELIYLTSYNGNLTIDNIKFENHVLDISDFTNSLSLLEEEYEIIGNLSNIFSKERVENGYFKFARIDYFICDLITGLTSQILKRGFVNQIIFNEKEFIFKLLPLSNFLLNNKINKVYSLSCRANFGDHKCGLDLKNNTGKTCDKTVESCKKFNNIINFRGEPYIPSEKIFLKTK